MAWICRLKKRRRTAQRIPNIEEERKLREELAEMLTQAANGLDDAKFVTDARDKAQAEKMRRELEYCAEDLQRMFYRASARVTEYAGKIKSAAQSVDYWTHNVGGLSVVAQNVRSIRELIDKWMEL